MPAHRSPVALSRCLDALRASDLPAGEWELIVADDASLDVETEKVAGSADKVIALPAPAGGPARARNAGVRAASARIVAFIDSDVLVHSDALRRLLDAFDDPATAAVFGSYDDTPAFPGIVSQYRNLLHHFVHQRSAGEVESFWAGCGAVRRDVFEAVGMFDEDRFRRPEMEDVELGYRLRDEGHRIILDPLVQCTHLKRWRLGGMIVSDFTRRGVPWARLLVERNMLLRARGLSLGKAERASAVLAGAFVAVGAAAVLCTSVTLAFLAALVLAGFVTANHRLFSWLASIRGPGFAASAVPLHLVYNVVAATSLVWGAATAMLRRSGPARYTRPR